MNSSVSKIFTGKLYFFVELVVAAAAYTMITFIFYYYSQDESFLNAFLYGGIFLVLQMIWQLFQERQDSANEEADHYPLKLSFFFFLTVFFGAIFLGLYFLFFHDVMSLHFKPIGPLNLLSVDEIDAKPDVYIRVQAFYDKYWSLTFDMNVFDSPDLPSSAVGCGCGVKFGPLLGTIASPVSSVNFHKKEFQDIVLMPTMTCFCSDADDCSQSYGNNDTYLYYRIHGNYENAIQNTKCPPETTDFIQIYTGPNVTTSNVQIIILFTLAYIPLMLMFINFMLNYSKFGVITFIKNHPNVRPKGLSYLLAYMMLKWVGIALFCFFVAERLAHERQYLLIMMACFAAVPGVTFGLFFFYFNPNLKFKQEIKNHFVELKDYADTTHESVENFVDLCVVGLQCAFKYLNKALKEFVIAMGFKGIAQSTSLFALIAPEFITEFINHEPIFQQFPTNIRDNLVINSMILITGLFHGLLMGAALIVYQLVYYKVTVLGMIAAGTALLFFIASTEWYVRQLVYFKSLKKALASHLIWLYPAFEIRLNRSLVTMYFNRTESRSEIPEQ